MKSLLCFGRGRPQYSRAFGTKPVVKVYTKMVAEVYKFLYLLPAAILTIEALCVLKNYGIKTAGGCRMQTYLQP